MEWLFLLFLMQQMLFYLFQRLCNMHGLLFLVILVLFSLLVSCFIHLWQYRYLDLYKTLSHHSCYDQYCYTSRASLTTYLGSSKRLFCFYYLVKTTLSNSLYSLRDSSSVLVNVWIRNLWLNRNILKLIYRQLFQGMIH